jgi:hypothetical protein
MSAYPFEIVEQAVPPAETMRQMNRMCRWCHIYELEQELAAIDAGSATDLKFDPPSRGNAQCAVLTLDAGSGKP